MLNLLLPWRWKHKIDAMLNAKFDSTRDSLIGVLNDVRSQLEHYLERRFSEEGNELAELGDGTINGLKETRAHLDVRLNQQTTYVEAKLHDQTTYLEAKLAQQDADLSELGDGIINGLKETRAHVDVRLNQQTTYVEAKLHDQTTYLEAKLAQQDADLSELGDGIINGLKETRAHIDVRLNEQTTYVEAELGDCMVTALKEVRVHLDAWLAEQRAVSESVAAGSESVAAGLNAVSESVVAGLNNVKTQIEAKLAEQGKEISELREESYNIRQALTTEFDDMSLRRLRSAAGDVQRGLNALKNEIAAQLGYSLHDMATQVAEQRRWLEKISADLANNKPWPKTISVETVDQFRPSESSIQSRLKALEQVSFDIRNLVTHLDASLDIRLNTLENVETVDQFRSSESSIQSRLNTMEQASSEIRNLVTHLDTSLHTRLNTLENVELPGLGEQIHEIAAAQIRFFARQANRCAWRAHPEERYVAAKPEPFEAYLARAAHDFPKLFDMWRERLETMGAAFFQTKVGNAAHVGDLYSRIFRDFVEMHATGRILDVGCGVFGRPYYLHGYPVELISGLEPLPMQEPPEFELVQGLAEYLPWPDSSFSTVISATSLDHCLSLERSLDEMVRMLRPDGRILLWIGSNPGAPKFEPNDPEFTPSDKFHLFHFDKVWFEPLLEEDFELIDRLELKRPGYSHILYSLRPKHAVQPEMSVFPGRQVAGSSR